MDNSPMENFFGILKQELFYRGSFEEIDELRQEIESYLH
ncbi:MAG: IS3 family transposase [Erysipelothrix sp.]|nr:IS3 family transposase [Erysipelothrix sp.]